MQRIINALKRIQNISGAMVDRNFLQGKDAVFAQLRLAAHEYNTENFDIQLDDADFNKVRQRLQTIELQAHPYSLPEDFIFFLAYCGGLFIEDETHSLMINGIGPMVEEWYMYLVAGFGLERKDVLYFGNLNFIEDDINYTVSFFLDIAGLLKQGAVIPVHLWEIEPLEPLAAMHHPEHSLTMSQLRTDSFTEWLEQIAETEGMLGYVKKAK